MKVYKDDKPAQVDVWVIVIACQYYSNCIFIGLISRWVHFNQRKHCG